MLVFFADVPVNLIEVIFIHFLPLRTSISYQAILVSLGECEVGFAFVFVKLRNWHTRLILLFEPQHGKKVILPFINMEVDVNR